MTTYILAASTAIESQSFQYAKTRMPALVSYYYWKREKKVRRIDDARYWIMDSGAYTAAASGAPIQIDAYIEDCHAVNKSDNPPHEIYGLDVIGDPEKTMRNIELMREAGIRAIPTFHYGSPWHYLEDMAPRFDKIAVGGTVGKRRRRKFFEQVLARVWPKKIHGFGCGEVRLLQKVPLHSADSSTWALGPTKFGYWRRYGFDACEGPGLGWSDNPSRALGVEIDAYAEIEKRLKFIWRKEMRQLDALPSVEGDLP